MNYLHPSQPSESGIPLKSTLPPEVIEAGKIVANAACLLAPYSAQCAVAAMVSPLIPNPAPLVLVHTAMPTWYTDITDTDALRIVEVIAEIHGDDRFEPLPQVRYDRAIGDIKYNALNGNKIACFADVNTPTRMRSLSRAVRYLRSAEQLVIGTGFDGHGPEHFDQDIIWIRSDATADAATMASIASSAGEIRDAIHCMMDGDHMDELVEDDYTMWNVPSWLRAWQRKVDVVHSITRPFMPEPQGSAVPSIN